MKTILKKIKYYNKVILFVFVNLMILNSCENEFKNANQNPAEINKEVAIADLKNVVGLYSNEFKFILTDLHWQYQLVRNLAAESWVGYQGVPTPFRSNINNTTYSLVDGWNTFAFDLRYQNVMTNNLSIKLNTETLFPYLYAISLINKVSAMSNVVDVYGAIPYTEFGNAETFGKYDSEKEVYTAFFTELDKALTILKDYAGKTAPESFSGVDLIYAGNFDKWIKLANSLILRLSIRLSKVEPELAKTNFLKADLTKIISVNADNAYISGGGIQHPMTTVAFSWLDTKMGGDMEVYLTGYNDPRLGVFFQKSNSSVANSLGYKGVRSGAIRVNKDDRKDFSDLGAIFKDNTLPFKLFSSAETHFLLAEARLRGWITSGSAKDHYETGIKKSFEEWSVTGVDNYILDKTSKPIAYVDPIDSKNNSPAPSNVTIAWDETDANETKLEKIITQKWIALFPDNSQEAWSNYRRTGYPMIMPIAVNASGGTIPTTVTTVYGKKITNGIQRINYPTTEKNTNAAALKIAVDTYFGGKDDGAQRLWIYPDKANF